MANLLSNTKDNNDNEKQSAIVLDYDLDEDEKKEIFQNYDFILCGKCNCKIEDKYRYCCDNCYEREIDETERNRVLNGKCKECFKYFHSIMVVYIVLEITYNKILTSGPVEIKVLIN